MWRRLLGLVLVLGVVAAACGDDGSADGGAAASSSTADTSETSDDDAAEDECRDVVHELGTACVPASPQRIVTLDPLTALPTLLDAGAPVVASLSVYPVGEPFPSFIDPADVADVEILGGMQEPNLEAIAAADPDLIIGSVNTVGEIQDQLDAIAPTVAIPYAYYTPDWREAVRLVGEAAGISDVVEADLAALDDQIAQVRTAMEDRSAPPTLTRVDVYRGTPLFYRFDCVWFGELLLSAGVDQPEAQRGECTPGEYDTTIVYPSLEELDVLDAEAIVAYQQQASADDVDGDPLAALAVSPIWGTLPAVQAERVHVLGDAWGIGGSVSSARVILDELVEVVFPPES